MSDRYNSAEIETKWQARWNEAGVFKVSEDQTKPKYYLLEMFPYPSGRIHMGHVRNYSIGDVVARFLRMRGLNVLHPMGWDAFGLPAENAAIAAGIHPAKWTYSNIENMKTQLKGMGFSYDWSRELATCDPEYYKWEQMVFIKLFEKGQAYREKSWVNYCPSCDTVLANEQVEAGLCWRCGDKAILREQWGWFLKITDYADELLDQTQKMDGWPERVLTMQRNWIGRSIGSTIRFKLIDPPQGFEDTIEVFTTRPDTLFGATFMSLAAEHPLAQALAKGTAQEAAVAEFSQRVAQQNEEDRIAEGFVKEGVFTGGYCQNPVTGQKIPIFAANFVLMGYGTGAVMAVPGHDQRDYDFAVKYDLPIIEVVLPEDESLRTSATGQAYTGPGKLINSGDFDGLFFEDGKKAITEHLAAQGMGDFTVNYRLRDWGISRQRYWGAPIPMIHCPDCGVVAAPFEDLPVRLPEIETVPEGGSPLARVPEFLNTTCPKCGGPAQRDTDTMDTFVESSWYFDRYCSPGYHQGVFDQAATKYWMPVDQYIGGIEHAVLHLLYARYWTKVLRDLGYLEVDEPFTRLLTQGMVVKNLWQCPEHGPLKADKMNAPQNGGAPTCRLCGKELTADGPKEKMSKSKGNTIDPEAMIAAYGADTVRLFCLFASPPEKDMDWSDEGIQGAQRFIGRVWRMVAENAEGLASAQQGPAPEELAADLLGSLKDLWRKIHQTTAKVTEEIAERWHFNTAIAAVMELVNETYLVLADEKATRQAAYWPVVRAAVIRAVVLLSPMVPHLADELFARLGGQGFLIQTAWPEYDAQAAQAEEVTVVLQVNGKVRAQVQVEADTAKDKLQELALGHERIIKFMDGKKVRKVIVVPDKLVNVVV